MLVSYRHSIVTTALSLTSRPHSPQFAIECLHRSSQQGDVSQILTTWKRHGTVVRKRNLIVIFCHLGTMYERVRQIDRPQNGNIHHNRWNRRLLIITHKETQGVTSSHWPFHRLSWHVPALWMSRDRSLHRRSEHSSSLVPHLRQQPEHRHCSEWTFHPPGTLTRPGRSEAEARCYEAEAKRKLWGRGQILQVRGQRCRMGYKNTIYDHLRSNTKVTDSKNSKITIKNHSNESRSSCHTLLALQVTSQICMTLILLRYWSSVRARFTNVDQIWVQLNQVQRLS